MEETIANHLTLAEKAAKVIENYILEGKLEAGSRIVESDVAQKLGISKSPVREALKKLEGDGIVHLINRRGYIVKNIDLKSIIDFFEIMAIMEPAIAKLAFKKRNEAICAKINEIVNQMEKCVLKEDYESYSRFNEIFHNLFYELTENEWIIRISKILRKQGKILRTRSLFTAKRISESMEEHRAIARAYTEGNFVEFKKAITFHMSIFQKNILNNSGWTKEEWKNHDP